jgi:hypothetical protein
MNSKKHKEININEESKIALDDYNTKKISMNIFYYKIFLGLCIISNIGLFVFILIYQNKIKEIDSLTKSYSSKSKNEEEKYDKQQSKIDNKLTNLIAISERRNIFFSYSFLNKSEYDLAKNFILEYHHNVSNINFEQIDLIYKIKMIYQSASDYFSYVDLVKLLNYRKNALIIVNSLEDEKFGIFLDEKIMFDKESKLISQGKKCFLFSFNSKKKVNFIGEKNGIKINDTTESIFIIGNEEIVIYNYFYNFGGRINYPLNSFEKLEEGKNDFINIKGMFDIKNLEIFEVYFN